MNVGSRLVNRFETALTRFIEVHNDPYADAEDRGDAKRALKDARDALLAALAKGPT